MEETEKNYKDEVIIIQCPHQFEPKIYHYNNFDEAFNMWIQDANYVEYNNYDELISGFDKENDAETIESINEKLKKAKIDTSKPFCEFAVDMASEPEYLQIPNEKELKEHLLNEMVGDDMSRGFVFIREENEDKKNFAERIVEMTRGHNEPSIREIYSKLDIEGLEKKTFFDIKKEEQEEKIPEYFKDSKNPYFNKLSNEEKTAVIQDMSYNEDLHGEFQDEYNLDTDYNTPSLEFIKKKLNNEGWNNDYPYFNLDNPGQKRHYDEVIKEYKEEKKRNSTLPESDQKIINDVERNEQAEKDIPGWETIYGKTIKTFPSLSDGERKCLGIVLQEICETIETRGSLFVYGEIQDINRDKGYIKDSLTESLFNNQWNSSIPLIDTEKNDPWKILDFVSSQISDVYNISFPDKEEHFYIAPTTSTSDTLKNIPKWAVAYMANGESDSLTEDEVKIIDEYMKRKNIDHVTEASESSYFTYHPEFGPGSDCVDVNVLLKSQKNENKESKNNSLTIWDKNYLSASEDENFKNQIKTMIEKHGVIGNNLRNTLSKYNKNSTTEENIISDRLESMGPDFANALIKTVSYEMSIEKKEKKLFKKESEIQKKENTLEKQENFTESFEKNLGKCLSKDKNMNSIKNICRIFSGLSEEQQNSLFKEMENKAAIMKAENKQKEKTNDDTGKKTNKGKKY